jgi:hypothetical protein
MTHGRRIERFSGVGGVRVPKDQEADSGAPTPGFAKSDYGFRPTGCSPGRLTERRLSLGADAAEPLRKGRWQSRKLSTLDRSSFQDCPRYCLAFARLEASALRALRKFSLAARCIFGTRAGS